jgi:TP901 family phage tail tape measure protein
MLRKSMGGMTKEQRIQTAVTLAGTDGMRGLLALYDAGPKKMAAYEKGLQKSGSAAQVAQEKQDNLDGALESLHGSVETLGIEVGTAMLPGIRKVTAN